MGGEAFEEEPDRMREGSQLLKGREKSDLLYDQDKESILIEEI